MILNSIVQRQQIDNKTIEIPAITEPKISVTETFERSKLPDKEFGIPSKRKYPLDSKKHVQSAIKLFGHVDPEDENELAKNIKAKIKKFNMHNEIKIGDANKFKRYWDESCVTESSNAKQLYPVFIVTVFTGTPFGKAIKTVTHSTYSHAALGLDPALSTLYSFNAKNGTNRNGGLSIESLTGYKSYNKDSDISVSVAFLKKKEYDILVEKLIWFRNRIGDTMYDFGNIFNIVLNKAKDTGDQLSMICSQFVDSMFKIIGVDITGKSSNLVLPEDLSVKKMKNPKIYKVFEGKINNYKPRSIINKIENLLNRAKPLKECIGNDILLSVEPVFEIRDFGIQFNDEGDLLVKKFKTLNCETEYYSSVKLIKGYTETNNIQGLENELCKLWFLHQVLIDRIAKKKSDSDIMLKGKILNTFYQVMKTVTNNNPNFNFEETYASSIYNDNNIRFRKSTIQHGIKALKQLVI